jgi:hypothetical protein
MIGMGLAGLIPGERRASASGKPSDDIVKMTKAQAEYQDTPKDIRMCATCSLYINPRGCKVVEGDVSPEGWCKAFDLAD